MLTQLSIRHIVLIESCDLSLQPGLCVLSGETGAGKSILLDALGLALGGRAAAGLLRQGAKQGSVTAEFDIKNNVSARDILADLGLEVTPEIMIRRTLTVDGKTRCYLNDQPVTVAALKRLGETLLEIHGQHDQRSLMDMALHRQMLDDFMASPAAKKKTAACYHTWKEKQTQLDALNEKLARASQEQDYLLHMRNELSKLAPEPGEEEELTEKRSTMMQSEKLFEVLGDVMEGLQGNKGAKQSLNNAQRLLSRSSLTGNQKFSEIIDALEKASIEMDEAVSGLEQLEQEAQYNPRELEQMEERLFALKAAARKYNLPAEELPGLLAEVEGKLALIDTQDSQKGQLEKDTAEAKEAFMQAATALSGARKKAATKLQKAVMAELTPLKMGGTFFHICTGPLEEPHWSANGVDAIRFECATNVSKGQKPKQTAPLNKIASGGELSRFMLALKVSLTKANQDTTLIFDEIDTGTGGAVADAIGQRLRTLGKNAQVLVVTHLPQVAAQGSQHLLVSKGEKGKQITTQVVELSAKERKEELARMLAGSTITAEARKAAQKLLEQAA